MSSKPIFFDSGADLHLIDGNVAVKEGLEAISSERTRLGLIAGGQVESKSNFYFTFFFRLDFKKKLFKILTYWPYYGTLDFNLNFVFDSKLFQHDFFTPRAPQGLG